MKAVILAAGKGERLKAITTQIPKPMIEIDGKPVLAHNVDLCKKYGINKLFLNLHHLPEVITGYLGDGDKFGVTIGYSYESELLGTAGAVRKIAEEFWAYKHDRKTDNNTEIFFVIYGDNYSEYDLKLLTEKAINTGAIAVVAFHYREDTEHSGVAEFAEDGQIIRFIEKPKPGESESHWVNAGIYCLSMKILDNIPEGISDFAKDIFPGLLANNIPIYGVCQNTEVKAFDTPEMYNNSFKKRKLKHETTK